MDCFVAPLLAMTSRHAPRQTDEEEAARAAAKMSRIDDLRREDLSPQQQELYDDITRRRPRPSISGPFAIWMHIPEIAAPTNALTNYLRSSAKLDQRLIELIVLLMCRDADVKYAWSVHEPLARAAGLSPETIDAIAARKRPDFEHDDEALIYDIVAELLSTKALSEATFSRAQATLGREGLIEAVSCAGFYAMVGLVLSAFDVPPQPGGPILS
jgi:4-carboxymuconolactone decarboxylase